MNQPATNSELDAAAIALDARRGDVTLRKVHAFLGRFVAYPSEHAQIAHTLWCAHAHLMDRWENTPRLAFLSAEPASGKSRALEITEALVPGPVTAVNVSPAYLFRKIGNEEGATILFDEIDTVFGPKAKENEEIRGLLNAGYRRGAVAGRCVVKGKTVETEEIPAYAAVALAGLGSLPDTILTRSVIIRMRRRKPGEVVEQYRQRLNAPQGRQIREALATWARSLDGELPWPVLPHEVEDRDADMWETLIAVADAAGGDWPARARLAAVSLIAEGRDAEPSLGIRLLSDLRAVFGNRQAIATKTILDALIALDDAPWADLRGKPLDSRGLAMRLKDYGVKPEQIRFSPTITGKGYKREHLTDAWLRYLPPPPDNSETAETAKQTEAGLPVSLVSDFPGDQLERV